MANPSRSACRSCGRGATSAAGVPGSSAPAGGARRSYTCAPLRFSRAVNAGAWPMRANGRSRDIGPSAERRRPGCALVGAPISSNGFPKGPAGCTDGLTIGCLPRRWRRRSARLPWSSTICVGTIPAFLARRTSPKVDFRHRRMQRAGWRVACQSPPRRGCSGPTCASTTLGPRGVERSADDRPQRHREGAA
jgi:hypothetical protein